MVRGEGRKRKFGFIKDDMPGSIQTFGDKV